MIPYRTRSLLLKIGTALLVIFLIPGVLLLCWMLWLNRYVIYTRQGAVLDFSLSGDFPPGQVISPKPEGEGVDIYYNEGENAITPGGAELKKLSGIQITEQMLSENFAQVEQMLSVLPADVPVMLDVKNFRGEFFYSSALGKSTKAIDPQKMDALLSQLRQTNRYLIARLPAFRDYWFGLENVDYGIFNPNRLSLWMDEERCYWLNPASQGTMTYLIQIVTELRSLGFDEVVFTDFCVPNTQNIYFEGDRLETINKTAVTLVKACETDSFAVSFLYEMQGFQLPQGRCRLYLENVAAADAAQTAEELALENPQAKLVFLTELKDTRFDAFGVLRPGDVETSA